MVKFTESHKKHWCVEETWSPEQLREYQEKRILEKLTYVYLNSPLHRKVWKEKGLEPGDIKSLEDFQNKVPCIDKDMVRKYREETGDPFGGLLCVTSADCMVAQSSGTTGVPTFPAYTHRDLEIFGDIWAQAFWAFGPDEEGMRPGDCSLHARPAFHSFAQPMVIGAQKIGVTMLQVGLDAYAGPQIFHYLRFFPVTHWYFCPAPVLEGLKSIAEQNGFKIKEILSNMKCVGIAGEVITRPFRRRAEEEFGTTILSTGGSIPEIGAPFGECGEKNGYVHMFGQRYYFSEVIDPKTEKPVPPGKLGEHTVTNFSFEAMPVLRYKTDDLVVAHREPVCPYGRNDLRIMVLGREVERLSIQNKDIFVSQIKECVEEIPGLEEGAFQVIKYADEMPGLRLRVGYNPAKDLTVEELQQRLQKEIETQLGISSEIIFTTIDELKKLHPYKIPRVASS